MNLRIIKLLALSVSFLGGNLYGAGCDEDTSEKANAKLIYWELVLHRKNAVKEIQRVLNNHMPTEVESPRDLLQSFAPGIFMKKTSLTFGPDMSIKELSDYRANLCDGARDIGTLMYDIPSEYDMGQTVGSIVRSIEARQLQDQRKIKAARLESAKNKIAPRRPSDSLESDSPEAMALHKRTELIDLEINNQKVLVNMAAENLKEKKMVFEGVSIDGMTVVNGKVTYVAAKVKKGPVGTPEWEKARLAAAHAVTFGQVTNSSDAAASGAGALE